MHSIYNINLVYVKKIIYSKKIIHSEDRDVFLYY